MLEDRAKNLLAEPCAVGVVWRLAFAAAADPVRNLFEHDGVPDEQLHGVGLIGGHADCDSHEVALALQRRPAALPGDLVAAGPCLTHRAVAGERGIFAVLAPPAAGLGD